MVLSLPLVKGRLGGVVNYGIVPSFGKGGLGWI